MATIHHEATAPQRMPAELSPRQRARRSRALTRQTGAAYMFLTPWLAGFCLLTIVPTLVSLYLSFTNFDLAQAPRWAGTANYEHMFTDDQRFRNALSVTFWYVGLSVPLKLAVALLIALVLDKGLRALTLYRALLYVPSLLGGSVAVAVLWRQIFGYDGLVNEFLALFGFDGPSWISNPRYSIYTLVILRIWQFGSPMVIFLAGLRQIPTDLYEAAAIDGAGRITQFFKITLPMLAPVVFFNLVLQTIDAFKAFTPAFIVSGGTGGPIDSTLFYTLYLYQEGFSYFRMGYASALAWVLLIIIAVFTAIYFVTSRYWVHYGDER
jgi:multiple sugar transport system permease protein